MEFQTALKILFYMQMLGGALQKEKEKKKVFSASYFRKRVPNTPAGLH